MELVLPRRVIDSLSIVLHLMKVSDFCTPPHGVEELVLPAPPPHKVEVVPPPREVEELVLSAPPPHEVEEVPPPHKVEGKKKFLPKII